MPSVKWFGLAFKSAFNKEMDIDTDTWKLRLLGSGYTPNQDTHQYASSLANECVDSGSAYPAGGIPVAGLSVSYDGATNKLKLDSSGDILIENASLTPAPRWAVIVNTSPATEATRPVLVYVDFDEEKPVTNGQLSITWNANGIATVTVS